MKHFNFLSKSSSRSCGHNVVTLASTVGSPSAHRRGTMLKLISVLVLILTFGVGQMWGADVTDNITATDLAATGTTYTNFSNVSKTSDAKYAGNSAKDSSGNIQLRSKNSNSGIVSTASGGTVKSVKITVGSGSNTVDVYGSNTAYTAASDLYNNSKQGTKVGSVTATGTISFSDDYAYVGIRSNSGAIYLSSVEITWTAGAASPSITTSVSSLSEVGYSTTDFTQQVKSFTVSGSSLTADVTVTAPTGYEVCKTENGTYTSSVTFDKGSGTLSAQTVYVRLASGKVAGSYSGNVTCTSTGATTKNVAVSGSVPFTVTWKANGTTHATTYVAYATGTGTALGSLPTDPDPEDYSCTGNAFFGWYDGEAYSHASTAPSVISTSTKITSNKTYNAVFATASAGEPQKVNDVLNRATTGITGTSYSLWSNKTATSDAVYAGNSAGGNSSIQMRSSDNSGLITTTSGGKAKKVTVVWNSNTASGRTLDIYGKNSAYSAASDLYGDNKGTKLGSIVYGTSTELTISGDYEYIGMRSNSGAMYLTSVTITWEAGSAPTYSNYATSCCEPLGQINGSFSEATQTGGILKWMQLSDKVDSWAVTYRVKNSGDAFAAVSTSATTTEVIETVTYNKYTITGLQAGKTYEFKLTPTLKAGVCALTEDLIVEGATQASYTITAQSNNTNYGTVELSGSTITASPVQYCRYATPAYSVSPANSATVAQEGNTFTVTPSANTTVSINFEPIPVTGVTMSSDAETLEVGGEVTLTAEVAPNTVNPNVTWTSSDETVATVDGGVVTATQKPGTTTITATSVGDNTKSATCTVTVVPVTEYKKVTANLDDWSGEYLLVYENSASEAYVWTGVDASNCYEKAEISNNKIKKPTNGVKLVVAAMENEGEYSIKLIGGTQDGKYIYGTSGKNEVKFSDDAQPNTISVLSGNATITSNTSFMQYNSTDGQKRFRYYKSGTTSQKDVQLYRKVVTSVVTITAPATGTGSLTLADGQTAVASGDNIEAGTQLTVTATPNGDNHYIGGTIVVKKTSDESVVTNLVLDGTTLTMPEYAITISASFTPTYAVTQSGEGGTIAWETSAGSGNLPAYFAEGTDIVITANADNTHTFTSLSLNNVENPDIDGNVAMFSMPASDVTATVVFTEKEDPSVAITDVEDHPVSALNFGTTLKMGDAVPMAQTFVISGANLTSALTVVSSQPSLYAVSVTSGSLTPAEQAVSATITVTPQEGITTSAGEKIANITISGGGLASPVAIPASMTVQQTYTANWIVNGDTEHPAKTTTDVQGAELTFPANPSATGDCEGLTFQGWKVGAIDGTAASAPSYVNTGSATMPVNGVNYYAVFAEESSSDETESVTWSTIYDEQKDVEGQELAIGASAKVTFNKGTNSNKCQYYTTGDAIRVYGGGNFVVSAPGTMTSITLTFGTGDNNNAITANVGTYSDGSWEGEANSVTFSIGGTNNHRRIAGISVTYSASSLSGWVTTCPHCNKVTLQKVIAGEGAEAAGNTIAFSTASTTVKTCEAAEIMVSPTIATGWELTSVVPTGVPGVTYDAGVISIPQGKEGTLNVTATFTQKNYEVALAQSPAAGATLNGATTTAHYNATINISTSVPDGYMFAGWTPANLFANTEAANAISTSFTMPNDDVTVTANFTQIYTVADALALVPEAGDNSDYVYVGGLISYVDETSWDEDYKNINYYISANGTRENELLVYHGYKGYNKVTFDAITDIKAGDKVIVYGKLTNYQGTKEFAQNNKSGVYSYIYQFTEAILSSVEVGGTLAKTDYFINDDFTREGLTATAVYSNTGYSKDITDEATWTDDLAGGKVTEDGTVRVTATYNTVSGYKDVEVTVTTKVLESIELSETALTGYLGQAVQKPATVTAHFDDNGVKTTENVTAFASFDDSDYDATSTAEQTITVSYQFGNAPAQTADYTITLSSIRNTIETAYTVEKGRSIIDLDNLAENNLELDDEGNKVFVQGYITDITNNKYTIKDNIEDTEFIEISEGTLGDGISSVKVGDLIKVEGNLYFYENNSHTVQKHQILNGEIVAVVRTPNLTVADVAEMEVNFTADLAEADLTIDRDGSEGAITFSCSDAAVTIVDNKLHAAEAGDATVTATIAASGIYTEASTTFNVHVIAERTRYAITMDANGGSGTDPEYANQLEGATVDLPATCPYSKSNSAFAGWVVNETISGDAVAVTNGHFTMPAAAVTIKATWNEVETCHISFQVSGGEVATAEAPQTVAYSLAEVAHPTIDGFTFLGWSETEYADETTTLPTMIESYTPALNESSKTLYGIYSQVVGGENQHYVLNYSDVDSKALGYGNATDITASDGSKWVVKAHKNQGMQINSGKNSSIKIPNCPSDIISIAVTGSAQAIGFSASDYSGSGSITYLVEGTNVASQTLDFEGLHVNEGYIVPDGGVNVITRIDVEYSGNVTYYTSSPVTRYNVTYAKGDATGVTGLCEAHRYAAGNITLCDAPTCADKNFTKWSDGTSLYNAGAEYTLSADVTFTATWTPKPKYTVTYTANGGTGTAPDVEEYMEDETVTVKENEYFSKPGFVYAGWQVVYNDGTDHIITPNDEGEFEMVAYNVTIKALWEEPSNQKWVRVESTDELATDGTNYIIVAKVNDAAMGALNGSYYNSIGIVKTGNYLNGPESMTKITLEAGSEEGKLAMKHGSKYIYSTGAKNIGERDDDKFDWTITIADGVATINAGTTGKLQFNTASPRFTTYTSSLQAVAIYREKALTPIDHDGMTEDDVNTYDDVEIGQDKTWTVSGEIEVGDVYMKEGAVIANSAEVTANDLYFKARHGKSNQIFELSKITVVSNMYYDFQLCDGDLDADYWYSIAVPFDVDLNSGVFQADGSPMTNRVDFEVWGYDTQLRAQTQSNGWKRVTDNMMHAGKAYLIGFNPGQPNIIRLKAAAGWKTSLYDPAENENKMSVVATGSGTHDNWNGLANPTMRYIDVDKNAQVFNNNTHGWDTYALDAARYNFVVGTAFFVQSASAVTISNDDHGQYRAPKRENENKCAYAVRISRDEAESFENQIIVRASEEATGEYTQGHDMLTMNNATSKTAAMLWTENYGGKRLAIEEAAWLNGTASYVLKMFAPAAGTYSISVAEAKANADLYLTYEGNIIWNLSESAYPIDLKKGTTEGYGLLLNAKMPMTPTGVETIDNSQFTIHNCQKVVIDEHVYILRGGEMYDVTGKAVK